MPSQGQRFRAFGLRPQLRQDLLQGHNAWTEGVAIVIDQFAQPSDQRIGLIVCQLKVHGAEYNAVPTS
jgi:hypothetical protein